MQTCPSTNLLLYRLGPTAGREAGGFRRGGDTELSRSSIDSQLDDTNFKLRLALRAAQIGIWDWELETGLMNYSPRARAICGFAPDELVTLDKVRAVTHPDDLPRTSQMARRALDPEQREKAAYEYRILAADTGEVRWVLAHGEAIFATGGGVTKATRYIGTIVDITDRKRTELALAESERRQRLAIEAAGMAVWEVDVVADTITTSPELNRIFGLPPDASPSIHELRQLYGPGERDRVRQIGQEALERGEQHFEAEFRVRRGSELCWLLLRAEFGFGPTGQVERVVGVLIDVDARKKAEEKQMLLLRELNHRVKNSLSVVQAIAGQTFRRRAEPGALDDFQARLRALSQANAVLLDADFSAFDLFSLIEGIVAPYRDPPSRITLDGAEIALPPRLNAPLALAIHELCTNAAKYGALSVADGRVHIKWEQKDGTIDLTWSERGGPPSQDKTNEGFGTRLITKILAPELGQVSLVPSNGGMNCRFLIQL